MCVLQGVRVGGFTTEMSDPSKGKSITFEAVPDVNDLRTSFSMSIGAFIQYLLFNWNG